MKRSFTGLALSSVLLLAGCGQNTAPKGAVSAAPRSSFVLDSTHSYLAGQVVVGLQSGVQAQQVAELLGGHILKQVPELKAVVLALPADLPLAKAVRRLESSGLARYAEPNYLLTRPANARVSGPGVSGAALAAQTVFKANDPELGYQWFLRNMGAAQAWETATGKGIRIGIADEDIDRHHPDLQANVVYPGYDAPNAKLITAETPYDGIGDHGTWVAGTAAAVGNNGLGGAGVAPEASIVPLTITHDPTGASDENSVAAFLFAVNGPDGKAPGTPGDTDTPAGHKAYVDVLNYSFGGENYSQFSKEAIDYVLMHGVVFVTSAGNTPTTGSGSPAWVPGAISVAATTPTNGRSTFSNMGSHLSVAAPGTNMWVTAHRENPNDPAEDNYAYVDGTSFASPATAGTAALILQAAADKNADGSVRKTTLTPAQVRHILEDTAYKPSGGYNTSLGNGIVRADAAVLRATQNAANTVEKGASVGMKFVAASDKSVGIPLVGVTLSGGTRRPSQLLYGQSASGGVVFSSGVATFQEIDAGHYTLYASGPRFLETGIAAGTSLQTLDLKPGDRSDQLTELPLNVTLPLDAQEPNDTPQSATPIAYGQVFNGVLTLGDKDHFKFSGKAGQSAFINTQTQSGSPDLKVSVLDATGQVLATNSSFRDKTTDAALVFAVPADGEYTVVVEDEKVGSAFNTYWVGLTLDQGRESEPNGAGTLTDDHFSALDFSQANALPTGTSLSATIDPASDIDIYTFAGRSGEQIVADLNAAVGGKPDTVMALYDGAGKLLASNDDTATQDSTVTAQLVADGSYYLVVGSYGAKTSGDYRVSLTKY